MIRRPKARVSRLDGGAVALNLPIEERALLAKLPNEIGDRLRRLDGLDSAVPPDLERLFPPAYLSDERAEANYVGLMRTELVSELCDALEVITKTAHAPLLSPEDAECWLTGLNSVRLVLGASLGVTEEPAELDRTDPRYVDWVYYHYLSYLEGELIEALSGSLPEVDPESEDLLPEDPWGAPLGGLRWDGTEMPPPS